VAPRKPPALVVAGSTETLLNVNPVSQSPPTANTAIPPILRNAMTKENVWIKRLLRTFTKKAKVSSPIPIAGTNQFLSASTSNSCSV